MSSPFAPFGAPFPGADPGIPQFWRVGAHRFWLGQPGAMIQLPSPDPSGYTVTASLGEVAHGLITGATALTMLDDETRTWTIAWNRLAGRDWQVVNGFYRRLFGDDPWCYVQPEDINHLTLAASMCGALHGTVEGWQATGGALSYDTAASAVIAPSGVIRWTGPTTGNQAVCGLVVTGVPTPDLNLSAPYVEAEFVTVYLWAWTVTGTAAVTFKASGVAADGTIVAQASSGTVTLTTTPQMLAVTAAPGDLAASTYVLPVLIYNQTGTKPDVRWSNPQLQYDEAPSDWEAGGGSPRVSWINGPGRQVDANLASSPTMTLAEALVGAA